MKLLNVSMFQCILSFADMPMVLSTYGLRTRKIYDTENLYSAFHQFIKVGERIWASRSYFA